MSDGQPANKRHCNGITNSVRRSTRNQASSVNVNRSPSLDQSFDVSIASSADPQQNHSHNLSSTSSTNLQQNQSSNRSIAASLDHCAISPSAPTSIIDELRAMKDKISARKSFDDSLIDSIEQVEALFHRELEEKISEGKSALMLVNQILKSDIDRYEQNNEAAENENLQLIGQIETLDENAELAKRLKEIEEKSKQQETTLNEQTTTIRTLTTELNALAETISKLKTEISTIKTDFNAKITTLMGEI